MGEIARISDALITAGRPSKKLCEFLNRKPGLSNDGPKGSLAEFFVIWNCQTSMRFGQLAKYDVAAGLMVNVIADPLKGPYDLTA